MGNPEDRFSHDAAYNRSFGIQTRPDTIGPTKFKRLPGGLKLRQ